jgi:hypothetical protein
VVIESDADIETSAKRVAWGKWLNCGQTCLAPDYIITTAALKPRVVAGLRKVGSTFSEICIFQNFRLLLIFMVPKSRLAKTTAGLSVRDILSKIF